MSRVNTVLGPIPAEELGFVAVHEHIGYGMPGSELDTQWWKTPEQRYEETVPKLRAFHEYAGPTARRPSSTPPASATAATSTTTSRCRRRPASTSSPATGFVGGDTALPLLRAGERRLPDRQFVHEITVGIGDTGSRAGVIKVGVSRGCPDDGPGQAHLPRRRPRRAAHRRADLDPPGRRRRARDRHLPRGGPAARPRALRARRRRRQRQGKVARHLDRRAGRPRRLRHLRLRHSSCRTRRSGAARARSGWTTSSASSAQGHVDRCSPRPTPTAARSAGRASRATPSTTSSRS